MIDESHVAVPQVRGQYAGDRSRKETLVEHGFRLPSALDNRPLNFDEFMELVPQMVFVSATPGPYEIEVTRPDRRAGDPPDRAARPGGHGRAHEEPDRRPARAPRRGDRARRAGPGHDAHQADGRGPHQLPHQGRLPGPVPAQRHRHDPAHRDPALAAPGRVRRPGRHQPAARGAGPARGLPGRDPRRRQGGLPALARRPSSRRSGAPRATPTARRSSTPTGSPTRCATAISLTERRRHAPDRLQRGARHRAPRRSSRTSRTSWGACAASACPSPPNKVHGVTSLEEHRCPTTSTSRSPGSRRRCSTPRANCASRRRPRCATSCTPCSARASTPSFDDLALDA